MTDARLVECAVHAIDRTRTVTMSRQEGPFYRKSHFAEAEKE